MDSAAIVPFPARTSRHSGASLQARWRNPETGNPEPLHTLNLRASLPAARVAVLEN